MWVSGRVHMWVGGGGGGGGGSTENDLWKSLFALSVTIGCSLQLDAGTRSVSLGAVHGSPAPCWFRTIDQLLFHNFRTVKSR